MNIEEMTLNNFWVIAPSSLLGTPLPLEAFKKYDEEGVEIGYCTIEEYVLREYGHTEIRKSTDGSMFVKGFWFDLAGLDELRSKLSDYDLVENENFWILNAKEVSIKLQEDEWNETVSVIE